MTTPEVPIGAKVSVSAGIGHVRWTGSNPGFAAGKWVGVELLEPVGKNDGSVKGERYFDCQPNHGVFVRPSQVKVLEEPVPPATPRSSSARPPATPTTTRLASTSSSRASSPQKPLTRTGPPSTPPRAVSSSSVQTSKTTPVPPTARRASATATPTTRSSSGNALFKRPPSVLDNSASARAPIPLAAPAEEEEVVPKPSGRMSPPPPPTPKRQLVSPSPSVRRVVSPTPSATSRHVPSRSISATLAPAAEVTVTSEIAPTHIDIGSRPSSPEKDQHATPATFAQKRELEELRIKVRILENRKHEDQERIKSLESKAGEADTLRAARVKLQAKFQEIQTALVAAQRSSRDMQSENAHLETRAAEAMDQLEMAALDREVAEEKAESAEMEVAKLNEKVAELELEVAVLKEENAEYEKPVSGVEGGERTSLAFVQLEKHNERLKEALIRLRDVSSEAERDYKAKVAELEKELTSQEDLLSQLDLTEAKLNNAEAQVEDLKQQLDDALGAEDMLEQLTERNLQMGERIEEMRVTIEDLEALKELNDELEENHVEAEKQLNAEIESLTTQMQYEKARSDELDNVILDMEATISQFRELVTSLQSELDVLRAQQATQEHASATTSKEAQALLNLNLKLQSTAVKAQSKTVDLELKKLEAAQLAEHMRIIQAYLPDPYYETESDSTTMFLFFNRVSAKVDMLISVISQIHGLPTSLHTATSETLVGVCELKGKLRHFSILNKRFSAIMRRGTTEDWIAFGKLLGEVGGVESKVDGWLTLVKSDEFVEGECARELSSLIAQFDHLAETAFNKPLLDVGELQLGLTYNLDCDLDNFAAAVGFARQAILSLSTEDDIVIDVGETSLEEGVYEPVQRILDLVRSVKVPSGKLVTQVEEIAADSAALSPEHTLALSDLAHSVSNAVDLAVQLAQRIGAHVAMIRSTKQPLRLADIETFLAEVTVESSAASDAPPWELIGMFITRIGNELGVVLPKVKAAVKAGQVVSLDFPAPWLARVAAIKEAASFNADTERKVVKLTEEVKDMLREIKIRDQSLQESGVKVETLERRLEASRKQGDIIVELENDVAKAKKQEKVYEDAIEQLQAEQDALEAENARLRKGQGHAGDRQANAPTSTPGMGDLPLGTSTGAGLESSQLAEQIENLRSAVRYLRSENALLKSKELYNEIHTLPALRYRSEPSVPDLVPSTLTSPGSPSSASESDGELPKTPIHQQTITRHSLHVESKLLLKEMATFQASKKVIDISSLGAGVGEKGTTSRGWRRRKDDPEMQIWEARRKEKRLEKKLEGLVDRAKVLGGRR
ncbi:hypothetical protein CI109_102869 [Kwoniella shandongensis]|uniref:Uncharacterized protein n=1 Tax=Kwoniella shandongensis TaxID=1734106 RepID=A0A5M6C8I7_9TREE|nr:uncharacterized protein CI109_000059 [Kwoniella shandongensis]KAA5531221.1 hypothetical protein CI109_000059 [Kwoniella shandongensis]